MLRHKAVGYKNRVQPARLYCVKQAVEPIAAVDIRRGRQRRRDPRETRSGWNEARRSMGAMTIVMVNEHAEETR